MNNRLTRYTIFCLGFLLLHTSCTEEAATATTTASVVTEQPVATQTPQPATPNLQKLNTAIQPTQPAQPAQNKPAINTQMDQPQGIVSYNKVAGNFVACTTDNKILPENIIEFPEKGVTVFVCANESTLDSDLGDSHRILEVKSSPSCEVVFTQTLSENVSADFPYYLSKDAINKELGFIGIRGFQSVCVFDVDNKKLYPDLKPKFVTNRDAADATSGMISHLFFDEVYCYGYAVDFGIFVFDMKKNASPLLPIVEYAQTQLFGFERKGSQFDLIIPIVTFDENGLLNLEMKTIFETPVRINPALKTTHKNGRYVILQERDGANPTKHLVVDMEKKEKVNLPQEIVISSIEKVKAYLK